MASISTASQFRPETEKDFQFDNWDQFVKHVRSRIEPQKLSNVYDGKTGTLLWGMPLPDDQLTRLAELHDGSTPVTSADVDLLGASNNTDQSCLLTQLTKAIGLAAAMPQIAEHCDQEKWLATLYQLDELQAAHPLKEETDEKDDGHKNSAANVLANELKLVLGYQFPELTRFATHRKEAWQGFESALDGLLDADGSILARLVDRVPLFLASWSRTILLAKACDIRLDDDAAERWEWFVRFAMRLVRGDGTSMLGDPSVPYSVVLYKTAAKLSHDKNDRIIARGLLPGGNPKGKKVKVISEEGAFSEWAGVGVFQQDWSPTSPRLAVSIVGESMRVEVCRGLKLFEMNGLPDISINGKLLKAASEWDEVCSHFDDEVDYLEFEIELEDGVRLQRQLCLIHDDEVMFIADAVFCETPERIDFLNGFSLAHMILPMQETENNEIYLREKEIQSLVLPLNLSEWKSAASDDKFSGDGESIKLAQSTMGKTLYAPVFVSLHPISSVQPRTWRRLSVAESMQTVSDDVARAYRVRVGEQQWVMYKSFEGTGNRTFLGQNQTCDLFIGRFQEDGNCEELLSLEN